MTCGACLLRGLPAGWSSCCCVQRSATGWVAPIMMIDARCESTSQAGLLAVQLFWRHNSPVPLLFTCIPGAVRGAMSDFEAVLCQVCYLMVVVQASMALALLQVYSLIVTPGQHANPLRRLWHELADRGEGLRSHWCVQPSLDPNSKRVKPSNSSSGTSWRTAARACAPTGAAAPLCSWGLRKCWFVGQAADTSWPEHCVGHLVCSCVASWFAILPSVFRACVPAFDNVKQAACAQLPDANTSCSAKCRAHNKVFGAAHPMRASSDL